MRNAVRRLAVTGGLCGSLLALGISAFGQETKEPTLSEQVQNPVAKMVSVPFQYNTLYGIGPGNNTAHVLNIQPVIPISLRDWNIITRTIVPVLSVPRLTSGLEDVSQPSGIGSASGLGDINFTAFLSPSDVSKGIWGIGPSMSVPTGTNDLLGSRKWSMGPSAVWLAQIKPWTFGLLARQLWSFAGSDRRSNVSQLLLQPFLNYNLRDGWYLSSAPLILANWEATKGNKWVVPVGGGVGRAFVWNGQKLNISLSAFYDIVRPEFGSEWETRFTVQFVL